MTELPVRQLQPRGDAEIEEIRERRERRNGQLAVTWWERRREIGEVGDMNHIRIQIAQDALDQRGERGMVIVPARGA